MVKTLHTNKGVAFTVSDVDYDFVSGFKWYKSDQYGLQCNGKPQLLHRLIAERAGIDCSNTISHIDKNMLNNQRSNLRASTLSQAQWFRRLNTNNTSGYKGVSWYKQRQKWRASIKVGPRNL